MTSEAYDRLSILYADACKALDEAEDILDVIGGRAGLTTGTAAAVTLCDYLREEIERYAPSLYSVKA